MAKTDIMELYTPFGAQRLSDHCCRHQKFAVGKPTAVVSTINGDSNVPFYKELANQGLKAEDIPVVAFLSGRRGTARDRYCSAGWSPCGVELFHVR